jgi:hypothetical protein
MLIKHRYIFIVFLIVGFAHPLNVDAATTTYCTISATDKVYVEVHDFSQGRKGDTTWSGTLNRGGKASVQAVGGEILIEWQQLSEENPRTENRTETCNGNTILVP